MEKDFLIEMEYAGLTGRLKRLSDSFIYNTKRFYRAHGLEIEPNWHIIFLILQKHEKLTIMEISQALDLSHSAIVQLVNKMKKKGYIEAEKDQHDQRKNQLVLSQKAKQKLPEMEKYWAAGLEALEEIMEHKKAILSELEVIETNLRKADFKERAEEKLKKYQSNKSS